MYNASEDYRIGKRIYEKCMSRIVLSSEVLESDSVVRYEIQGGYVFIFHESGNVVVLECYTHPGVFIADARKEDILPVILENAGVIDVFELSKIRKYFEEKDEIERTQRETALMFSLARRLKYRVEYVGEVNEQ